MNRTILEQRLNKQKARIGLTGGRLKLIERAETQEPLQAHIDPSDWHIEIAVQKDYSPVRDKRTAQYVQKRNMADPLEKICEDLLYHECGHWELPRSSGNGCPYDVTMHDRITEQIATVLKKTKKQQMAAYVTNMFEDVLDNTNCKLYTSHAGQILFWNEQGMTHGKYTKAYDAFVRLNLALWGDTIDNTFLKRWYTKDKNVTAAVKKLIEQWNLPKGRDKEALRERVTVLYQRENWLMYAQQFAEAIVPLLDEPQMHLMFGGAAQGTGAGEKQEGNRFDKELRTPEGQEKASHGRYTAGTSPATTRDSFEQLDALYRKLARNIPVETETLTKAYSFPLVPWGREQFDPEQHDLRTQRVSFGIQDDGTVGLVVNRGWIETEETYKRNVRRFPKFRLVVLDTSESMKAAPDNSMNVGNTAFIPWGDNSKYHYALLGYYGIERYLQSQHIAPYVERGAINFSKSTVAAVGEEAHKLLLRPQFGGTVLDVEKMRAAIPDNETLVLSLSDGDIQNWSSIRETYKGLITHCTAAHIQLGAANAFSRDLQSWGIPVFYVQSGEDLSRLMVRITKDKYMSYARTAVRA